MTEPPIDARDTRSCRAVLLAFLGAVDHGRATEALELFTPDASFAARGERLRGHTEIARFLAAREADTDRQTAHVVANDVAERIDDDHLELRATVLLHVRRPDGSYGVERILDTIQGFRHTEAGWRIEHRGTSPLHR